MTPVTLSPDELEQVIKRVAPTGKEYGSARIVRMLAAEHSVHTVRINTRCSIQNISDQVSKGINPRIRDLGLYVACVKPPRQIYNKFGQPSGQMLWAFYRDSAANDPAYHPESLQDALRRDLSALQAEFPLDYPPSLNESAEAWESALELSEFQAQVSSVDGLESANDPETINGGGGVWGKLLKENRPALICSRLDYRPGHTVQMIWHWKGCTGSRLQRHWKSY